MASVRQIAKHAGVSTATVSRVINNSPKVSDSIRRKVLAAINDQHYAPKVGKLSATNVAYIFTDTTTLGSPYDAGIMAGLSTGLEHNALDLLVLNAKTCRQPGEGFDDVFRRKGVCGAIVRNTFSSRTLCRAIFSANLPVIVLGDQMEGFEDRCVDVDSRSASREAVEHLIGLGHRRIAFCTNVVDDKDHEDRFGGYRDALELAGLEPDPKQLFRVPASRQGGEQFARRLASMAQRPTALFVADPDTCVGVMNELSELKLDVPGDISIVGFDDAETRYGLYPKLTAVCQDSVALGRYAISQIVKQVAPNGNGTDESGQLLAWFEVNASTGAPSEN